MQVSARVLGKDYGLTAEEMNRVLAKQGFLKGIPGDYSLTPKAWQYAVEKDFHRGNGGYACFNRYWTTRTFDDSIKDVLDVSTELVSEVRSEIAAERAVRYAARAAEKAQEDAKFLANQVAGETKNCVAAEYEELIAKWKKAGKIGLAIGGVVVVGYIIYKVTPRVRKWWESRKYDYIRKQNATV